MNKYEKILSELCYTIRIRNEYYNAMCKEKTQEPNILTAKLIYNDLNQTISWLFGTIKDENEKETIWD